jgi:ribosomal protein S2
MTKNISNLNLKLTLNQMLLSNVHVGHTKKFLNSDIKPYLLGTRNNLYILNIAKTSFQFKLFINLLVNITSLRQKVLVVKERDVYNFRNLLNLKQLYYSDGK